MAGGADAVRRLLARGVEFDAIAAANDYMALAAVEVLRKHGKNVPGEIPVLGFDDISNAVCSRPSLSTLRQPMWWLATEAVRLVMCQLDGQAVPAVSVGAIELVRRESCGCGVSTASPTHSGQITSISLMDIFGKRRDALERALVDAVLVPNHALGNWAGQLLDALESEISDSAGVFLRTFEGILDQAQDAGANPDEFQRAITVLRSEVDQCRIEDEAEVRRLEQAWHAARLCVAAAALRDVGSQRNEMQHAASTLGRSGERFATAMSLPLFKQALLEELPALTIEQGAVSLYQSGFESPLLPFLVLGNRQEILVPAQTFAAVALAPDAAFESERLFNSVVMPLTFEGESLGIAVFSAQANASVYGVLRQQISSAIQVVALHRRMIGQVETRERLDQIRMSAEAVMATTIQTSMSPVHLNVPGLEIAHVMIPTAEAGGDYYDVLPDDGGAWLAIGDVAGHGLGAGLISLMLQSVIAGLARNDKNLSPSQLISATNEVIYDNVRNRLRRDEHATLTVFRYLCSGHMTFAGAHEPIIVFRAKTGRCELVETPGFWVGVLPDARALMEDSTLLLHDQDVILLYTDGVTEARNAHREQFGLRRLVSVLEASGTRAVADILDGVLSAVTSWSSALDDDVTLLVIRYRSTESSSEHLQPPT